MKILYAIQGTGNGHLSRAKEVIPALLSRAQVDILVSGTQSDIDLPYPIKYKLSGISFVFGKNGGIDYWKSLRANNLFRIIKEIRACNVKAYDLIINDFEPITAWASYLNQDINCVALSHQSALLSKQSPKPEKRNRIGEFILRNYAPTIVNYGFHFKRYDKNINLPIIRKDIRMQQVKEKNYYVIYLPAYSDKNIIEVLSKLKTNAKWYVFSKHSKKSYKVNHIKIKPVGEAQFEKRLAYCKGVICGAGFETPAEALYLRKKLLVIPMKGQYEQLYNAASLKGIGVDVLPEFNRKHLQFVENWMHKTQKIELDFPDKTQFIIDEIITNHIIATELSNDIMQQIY
ncbi:glycosyltransferase family protein [Lacinutrix iliipiscaria]|uniref:Glycosyltransferase family protein n=1 Tax=Lacinutrix iliipiscaria TaxID=1230532 RepID=A0ABW5WJU7_9FLAO